MGKKNSNIDITALYFKEVEAVKPMTAEDEIEFGKRIALGGSEAEKARREMADKNLRLVLKIAGDFKGKGLEYLDIVSAGNLGLMKAVEGFKFDRNSPVKFSTYACPCIRSKIIDEMKAKGLIRISASMEDLIYRIDNAEKRLTLELDRVPTIAEIAEYINEAVDTVEKAQSHKYTIYSLENPVGEDTVLGDLLENANVVYPEAEIEERELRNELDMAVSMLPEREEQVIRLLYWGDEPYTLEEVGKMIGDKSISKERVRQIREKALEHLRTPRNRRHLEDFYLSPSR